MKKKIISVFLFLLVITACVSCAKNSLPVVEDGDNLTTQQLQILKSDLKLTQEQVLSQMKAEYIKKNNGYLDTDEILSIITLSEDSILDLYLNHNTSSVYSVSEYAKTTRGKEQIAKINEQQLKLINELKQKGLISSVEHQYSTIINGISVKTTYGQFKQLENVASVQSTIICDTYNLPQSTSDSDTSAIVNLVDVYETGIFNSSSVDYTGDKTAVAVLDSGFDCSHTVFANQPQELLLTRDKIRNTLNNMNASKTTEGLDVHDVYYSDKIPFVYDYADKDPDVSPYDSEHGTHVAGIIGGKDEKITGVAINTQLVLLKVFPDLDAGADYDDILAALEDAVALGVDAINMSLGSSCGFAREADGNFINTVYDKISESGISILTAASNSYSSSYGSESGNTNYVTNPDSGTVGSPSTYATALSVASISGVKSRFMVANGSYVLFFTESNAVTGKANNFIEELGLKVGETKEFEYVTIPGVGKKVNYTTFSKEDLEGKIALVRRGDNTFEEKALNAKNAGAIACIIYNNIEGDILMSMGKTDHIPTISISKDDGIVLSAQSRGTLTISYDYQAGPFMSDFSSWGPTPSLGLKPEITAHGGEITSSVPGGGYNEISGTSMATPNLCGIVVLIRQYLKEKYPTYTAQEISKMANQLLMSTATIVKNEDGNPYSPRKQGAGLASLYNVVNTNAYITVDGTDRTKLELYDDPDRTGIYKMKFNVNNLSNSVLAYDLSVIGMTESVSTSDSDHVAEKSQLLNGVQSVDVISGGTLSNNKIMVNANETAVIEVVYTLSQSDKDLIDSLFPYGMYVEGFVKLEAEADDQIDLNIPFLAFYGDWTEAPLFDKTFYEVETEAHNPAIDDEDKIKADYYATIPYGSYFYNYMIPLGAYVYQMDENVYDPIPATQQHIAISNVFGTINGITSIYTGLLRNAKTMTYTITDKITGEVIYEYVHYNATKAHSINGTIYPYADDLKINPTTLGLVNNRQYEFTMVGMLDYKDGGLNSNLRNTFSFDFYLDDEAPILKEASYEKIYDKTLKKDRYYITMTIYDNQYVQSITPIIFTSSSSYDILSSSPIPVYSEKGQNNTVRFEITDYLDNIYADALLTSGLAFAIDDYALNSNIYMCQLPGTKGDFKFTKDGTEEGSDLLILSMYEDEVVDLTKYLYTADPTVDENKDYLKYLQWRSSNEKVALVQEGQVRGLKAGRATITVVERMDLKQAVLIINVKQRVASTSRSSTINATDATIDSIRFSYFDTLFAYSRASQTSEIGATGDRKFISSISSLSFYPGEKIQLFYDFDPWYAEEKYELTYTSTNPNVATVDENGVVTGLKEGSTNIVLNVSNSNLKARIRIEVKNEFIIEGRTLVAYKGLGGNVVIPDDEGILYIGSYAFCLYDTDNSIELTEEDYDANKIPSMNTSIKSIVVPEGVEEIQRFAFYNCPGLESVELPESTKIIREYAFCKNVSLRTINLENILVIGREAFRECEKLSLVNIKKAYTIGVSAFEDCSSLTEIDLTNLRNTGIRTFKDCTSLKKVTLSADTKLSEAMFVNSGLLSVDIYEKVQIPAFCFAQCKDLVTVNIQNDLAIIGKGAFSECTSLTNFNMNGHVLTIGEQAFYASDKLSRIVLPNNEVTIGNYCFYKCSALEVVEFRENTKIAKIEGSVFEDTNLTTFIVNQNNPFYGNEENLLVSKDGTVIILSATSYDFGDLILDNKYLVVSDSAFCDAKIKSLTIINPNLVISDYAFANCDDLTTITFPSNSGVIIGRHAFNHNTALVVINNLDKITEVGDYAFANTGIQEVVLGENANFGEGVFFQSKVQVVTIGANSNFGLGAFQNCLNLEMVKMPDAGNVHFGKVCFAYDRLLKEIDLSKVDNMIEDQTFYGCSNLKVANLANVTEIGEYAFADCSSINTILIPKVVTIGEGAFSRYSETGGAPQILNITLPETLISLGDGAFLGCEYLSEVTLPKSLQTAGDYLFAFCLSLEKVVLPSSLKRIGLYSFAGCQTLTQINLENIEEIDNFAFTSCGVLSDITLTNVKTIGEGSFASTAISGTHLLENLLSVGNYAFQSTSISQFDAPKLETIGDFSFQNNRELTKFGLSNKLVYIGQGAFNGCSKLEKFYNLATEPEVVDGKINDYIQLDNGVLYTLMENGGLELSSVPQALNVDTLIVLEGTRRVKAYAGNDNVVITKIVLPDSLKIIGNYAFNGYKNLEEVEFKSIIAPALESSYNSNASLTEEDPGYELLHRHFDIFGYFSCYYTFIDLVGKVSPIKMTLPNNENINGYDSIIYEAYFGTVANANRSNYVAREVSLVDFIDYANKIAQIQNITLANEALINNAVTAYNSIKQNASDYGYDEELWNEMVETVMNAKKTLSQIKLSKASKEIQELQTQIEILPTSFDITKLNELKNISNIINSLTFEERALLDLTNYDQLVASYQAYREKINNEINPVVESINKSLELILVSTALLSLVVVAIIRRQRVLK